MDSIPVYIPALFFITALITIGAFYWATRSRTFLIVAIVWMIIQSFLGLSGFYEVTDTLPPRLMLTGVLPTIIAIIILFNTEKGRAFIDSGDLRILTYLHTIRVPVEITLTLLFHFGMVSKYMTYEGTNFDMISGITAPVIGYLAFRNNLIIKRLLFGWNVLCLVLLANVVITAIFALPSPFQKIAFDQPNIAVLYFPFNLLPTLVVPLVLFSHLIAFRKLKKL